MSKERLEKAMAKMTDSIQKLGSIKQQIISLTNRVNALKKVIEPQPEAATPAPEGQQQESADTQKNEQPSAQ